MHFPVGLLPTGGRQQGGRPFPLALASPSPRPCSNGYSFDLQLFDGCPTVCAATWNEPRMPRCALGKSMFSRRAPTLVHSGVAGGAEMRALLRDRVGVWCPGMWCVASGAV
uniref:Uncharacterized protein n=1 Tax=Prymnesium polylepis TaxID=72548 RepID=A0A6T7WQU7_9EUKA